MYLCIRHYYGIDIGQLVYLVKDKRSAGAAVPLALVENLKDNIYWSITQFELDFYFIFVDKDNKLVKLML